MLLSCACTVKALSASPVIPPGRRVGVDKKLGGDTADPNGSRDVPHHMVPYSAHRGEGRRRWGMFAVMAFVFPSHHCR